MIENLWKSSQKPENIIEILKGPIKIGAGPRRSVGVFLETINRRCRADFFFDVPEPLCEWTSVLTSDGRMYESIAEQLLHLFDVQAGVGALINEFGYRCQIALFALDVPGTQKR